MRLILFPTTRAIRSHQENLKNSDGFLPKLLTIDDFERKAILIENKRFIDESRRVLFLKEAASFKEFKKLEIDDEFFSFLKNSNFLFRFFEELSFELVEIEELKRFDSYAEFIEHLDTLKKLKDRYINILDKNGFFDKITIPALYKINKNFIKNYKKIEIFLEGFLTRFEIELFKKISKITEVVFYFKSNRYNKKMRGRFKELGFDLDENFEYEINLSKKEAKKIKGLDYSFDLTCTSFSQRAMQLFFVKKKIFDFINSGIKPEKIAVVLPDENFKDILALFDEINNLNFAMGFDFKNSRFYKALTLFDKVISDSHIKYGYEIEKFKIGEIVLKWFDKRFEKLSFNEFEEFIKDFYFLLSKDEKFLVDESLNDFRYIYEDLRGYEFKKILHIFLSRCKNLKIEDNKGGKITVLGVLETRSISYDGVIVVDFNENIVPKVSEKDFFLNSMIKKLSGLPTKKDRENLQKYYYYELFRRAKKIAISFVENEIDSKSRFLDEIECIKKDFIQERDYKRGFLYSTSIKRDHNDIVLEYDFKKENISPSKLKDFLECKRRFYYKYIKKIKSFEIPSIVPKENEIGEALHKILLKIYKNRKKFKDIEELKGSFFYLAKDFYKDKNLFFRLNMDIWGKKLEKFFENEIERFKKGIEVYEAEKYFKKEFNGFVIEGKIDRIDKSLDGFEIIDYKSGRFDNKFKKDLDKVTDFQLPFYYLLAKDLGDIKRLCYYDLKSGKLEEERQLNEKLNKLEEIFDSLKKIEIDFKMCEDEKYCRFCPYRLICGR